MLGPRVSLRPILPALRRLVQLRRRQGKVCASSLVVQVVDVDANFKLFGSAFGGGDLMAAHSMCHAIVDPHPDPARQTVTVWHHSLASQLPERGGAGGGPRVRTIGWGT